MSGTIDRFVAEKYINLETFKKSGQAVATPVWFSEEAGVLYVVTPEKSGKVKRIRNNGRVRIVPSNARGVAKGDWVEAQARVGSATEQTLAEALTLRKYGWQKRLIDLIGRLRGWRNTALVIKV